MAFTDMTSEVPHSMLHLPRFLGENISRRVSAGADLDVIGLRRLLALCMFDGPSSHVSAIDAIGDGRLSALQVIECQINRGWFILIAARSVIGMTL